MGWAGTTGKVGTNDGPYRHIDFGVLSVPSLLLFQLPLCLLSLLLSQRLQVTASLMFLEHLVAFELFMMGCIELGKVTGGLGKGRQSLSSHSYVQGQMPAPNAQPPNARPLTLNLPQPPPCPGSHVLTSQHLVSDPLLSHNTASLFKRDEEGYFNSPLSSPPQCQDLGGISNKKKPPHKVYLI